MIYTQFRRFHQFWGYASGCDCVTELWAPNSASKFSQLIAKYLPSRRLSFIKVLDQQGNPICGGEVDLVGLGCFKTNKHGCVRFYIPRADFHPLTNRFDNYKETNLLQEIKPATTYVYQPEAKLHANGIPARDNGGILVEQ